MDDRQNQSLNLAFSRALVDAPDLPPLAGTFRQVRWATCIRAKLAIRIRAEALRGFEVVAGMPPSPGFVAFLRRAAETSLCGTGSAADWLDWRERHAHLADRDLSVRALVEYGLYMPLSEELDAMHEDEAGYLLKLRAAYLRTALAELGSEA